MSNRRNVKACAAGSRHGWIPQPLLASPMLVWCSGYMAGCPSRRGRVVLYRLPVGGYTTRSLRSLVGEAFVDDPLLAVGGVGFDEGLPGGLIRAPGAGGGGGGVGGRGTGPRRG